VFTAGVVLGGVGVTGSVLAVTLGVASGLIVGGIGVGGSGRAGGAECVGGAAGLVSKETSMTLGGLIFSIGAVDFESSRIKQCTNTTALTMKIIGLDVGAE
jgi:hypothetical protein